MTDWTAAGIVALTGVALVFSVLGILGIAVTITGIIFEKINQTRKAKVQDTAGNL